VGTTVQLTATPRDGTKAIGFVGDCASTSATCTVIMYHDRTATVQLDPARFPITVVVSGNGSGSVNDFATNVTPRLRCIVTRGVGDSGCTTTYPFGATLRFSLQPSGSSKVTTVGETSCVSALCTVTGPVTLTATFTAPEINITGAGSGGGRVVDTAVSGLDCTITPVGLSGSCSKVFDMIQATNANFTPVPAEGSVFVGYSGLCTGIQACSTSGDFPPNTQLVARFDLAASTQQSLTVLGAGNGSGTIQSSPGGIACNVVDGTAGTGCTAAFTDGVIVTLSPAAAANSQFAGWAGACSGLGTCSVAMTQARSVTARFERNAGTVALTLMGAGTGNGIVTSSPGGAQCVISGGGIVEGASCSITFAPGTPVTLTAEPRFGSTFGRWEGDACANSTELTCTFTLSANRTVAANFISPHSPHDLALALTGAASLSSDERAQLDRLGNKNGTFDLGDLLAFLDRTKQKLTPTDAAAVMKTPQSPAAASPKTRRVP
jgi:hypothetical protein